jgi:peptidoglycan/xylan/chitin deacetylase (PgdA/CDA1 family)
MHNGAKYTAQALQGVIDGLKEKGYSFVTMSELIMKENYYIDHTGRQKSK